MCPNMYLNLQEYIRFGGDISIHAEEYSRIEYAARRRIDLYTFGRVKHMREVPEAVKRLMFEMIRPQALSATAANSTSYHSRECFFSSRTCVYCPAGTPISR